MPSLANLFDRYDPGTEMTGNVADALFAQLKKSILGGVDPTTVGALGMTGLAGIMPGRPQTQVPASLQTELGGGFRPVGSSLGKPSVLQPRNPAGTSDIPSWDAVASTESPAGRTGNVEDFIKRLMSR